MIPVDPSVMIKAGYTVREDPVGYKLVEEFMAEELGPS